MKAYLKKTLVFIVTLYALLSMAYISTNYYIKIKADFKLPANINKIIVGNSQPECAYNDSLITNFKNLSKSGETYFYTYQKLKMLVHQNSQIDTVFIEFSNANILVREDEKIWQDRFIKHQLPNYSPFLDWQDYKLLIQKNPIGTQKAILASLKKNSYRIATNNYNYKDSIGGYLYSKRQKVKAILDTAKRKMPIQKKTNEVQLSQYDLLYLDKIIILCQKNNITSYLIRSPYHPKFNAEKYDSIFNKVLKKRFSTVSFLDFKTFPLKDSEYGDLQHLNYKGAHKFSKQFNCFFNVNKEN